MPSHFVPAGLRTPYLLLAAVTMTLLVVVGCEPPSGSVKPGGMDYRIRTIDGCEYIEVDYGVFAQRVYSLTHKGNCRNPIHHYNAEAGR
jgi:hypothetical protein